MTKLLLALVFTFTVSSVGGLVPGARQQLDKATCAVYRPVWPEYDRTSAGRPTTQYGPEAPRPTWLVGRTSDPSRVLTYQLWVAHQQLYSRYAGIPKLDPIIGHDQYQIAFAVLTVSPPGYRGGPYLSLPAGPRPAAGEARRLWDVDSLVAVLSWPGMASGRQLDIIRRTLRETPTCGGRAY